ncbi:MAG: ubiquinone/menaquinone biosynthesis methyltransferase [Acidimicrobiales bacterium]
MSRATQPAGRGLSDPPLPTGADKTALVRSMFDTIAPRYDLVNRVMTFGLDVRWRRRACRSLGLPAGSTVLDVACGTGDFLRELAHQGMAPVGVDLSWGMLAANTSGEPLVQADAARLPVATGSVAGVTCGYALRNVTDLEAVLAELARVLKPSGRLSLLEVSEPTWAPLRLGHRLWFTRAVPVIGALLSDAEAYRYLPRSVAYLPDEDRLRTLLVQAGFSGVNRRALLGGASQLVTATRSASAAATGSAPGTPSSGASPMPPEP